MTAQVSLLLAMAWHFALISFFAVGGGVSMMIPQMDQEFVQQYHWLDQRAFTELLAVAQAAPGPNFLLVPLIAWRVASWPGLVVSLVAFLTPPALIAFFVGRWLHRRENAWTVRFRRAFRPVTAGLWIASGTVVALTVDHALVPALLTAAVAALSLAFDIPPLWWCLAAGIIGAVFV